MGNADKTPLKFWRTHLAQNHTQEMKIKNEISRNENGFDYGFIFVPTENGEPKEALAKVSPGVYLAKVDLDLDPEISEQNLETLKFQESQLAKFKRLIESVFTLTQEASARILTLRLTWKPQNERLKRYLDQAAAWLQMAESRSFTTNLQALVHLTSSRTFSDTDPPQSSRRASFTRLCCCA